MKCDGDVSFRKGAEMKRVGGFLWITRFFLKGYFDPALGFGLKNSNHGEDLHSK